MEFLKYQGEQPRAACNEGCKSDIRTSENPQGDPGKSHSAEMLCLVSLASCSSWDFQGSSAPGPASLLLLKGCLLSPSQRITAVTQSTATVSNLKIPGMEFPGRILDDVLTLPGGAGQVSAHQRVLTACVCIKLPPLPAAFFSDYSSCTFYLLNLLSFYS